MAEKRDNVIVYLPKAFIHPSEFAAAVAKVERKLIESGQVVRIRHELDYDSMGEPAVYFRIVMPDASVTDDKLLLTTDTVSNMLLREVHPGEDWGVFAYFDFRSSSGQEALQEPSWA